MHDSQGSLALFGPIDTAPMRVSRALHARGIDRGMRHAEQALAFVQRRVAAHRHLVVALSAAAGVAEQNRMWAEYCQETMRDYAARTNALGAELMDAIEMTLDDVAAAGSALRGHRPDG